MKLLIIILPCIFTLLISTEVAESSGNNTNAEDEIIKQTSTETFISESGMRNRHQRNPRTVPSGTIEDPKEESTASSSSSKEKINTPSSSSSTEINKDPPPKDTPSSSSSKEKAEETPPPPKFFQASYDREINQIKLDFHVNIPKWR